MKQSIARNITALRARIEAAAARSGRTAEAIKLVAVSKTFPAEIVAEAVRAGQRTFGENYVQEALEKIATLKAGGLNADFHFIGKLQTNKVKEVVGVFSLIHSVHKFDLAKKISKAAHAKNLRQDVLVQVNISEENSKSGAAATELETLCRQVSELPGLKLCGLMCIGEYVPESAARAARIKDFVQLRTLRDQLQESLGLQLPELSMGMSHDFELAIEEGATIIRVGSAIFGTRG